MLNSQWQVNPQSTSFLRHYKPDSAKVLCIASNEHFSVYDGGKNDIDRHIKLKRHNNNIKSFGINRQLITLTLKSNKKVEETAAAEEALEIIVKYSNLFDFHQLVISSQIGSIEKTCVSQALQKVNKMNDEFNSTSMINNEKRTSAAKLVNQ
ncbi:unnamed protein product [Rotaria sp. Silwood1]|nr:unnamed protein product [Rotaria sp. Silwood1]CAF1627351.1 unnamed protein product [Rotaria sp. Silwood1]